MKPRLVFFGSSDFSIPLLEGCLESPVDLVCVITTPDQRKGRGLQSAPNVVRQLCSEKKLPCEAPETLKDAAVFDRVKTLRPDIFVVASYGKIIPAVWLEIPQKARFNVHPSLLPKYRGAAPLNWPLLNGDAETGLCIAEITAKLDSGDIFYCKKIPLARTADSLQLSLELSQLGKEALKELLDWAARGEKLKRQTQNEAEASYARKLQKEDGCLTWEDSAEMFERKIRGLKPWPGAFIFLSGQPMALIQGTAVDTETTGTAGTLISIQKDGSVRVQTGRGILQLNQVKPAGKGIMTAADFVRGRRLEPGAKMDGNS